MILVAVTLSVFLEHVHHYRTVDLACAFRLNSNRVEEMVVNAAIDVWLY